MRSNQLVRLLAYVSGSVNRELLAQNEYLAAENRILRAHVPKRLRLTDSERITLAEIGKRIGRKALASAACVATPETILGWYRKLVAKKFDGSRYRQYPGRPRIPGKAEELILRFARENPSWGYSRISGALMNLGHEISRQTIANVLKRNGLPAAPERSRNSTWKDFISTHMSLMSGMDFFSVEVLSWRGLVTCYVLFLVQLESRRVTSAGITRHPTEEWMAQTARNITDPGDPEVTGRHYLLHDRDSKFCESFRDIVKASGNTPLKLPVRSPNLNAFAERWVRSVKYECLHKLILFGEGTLRRALAEYTAHYHQERNHQGKENLLLFPTCRDVSLPPASGSGSIIRCRKRLGGLLKYYSRAA